MELLKDFHLELGNWNYLDDHTMSNQIGEIYFYDFSSFSFIYSFFRVTLGNQLEGVNLLEEDLVKGFRQHYPDGVGVKQPS